MPMGRAPLSDDVIAQFEKWIAEGAKYDGGDPSLNVGQVAALAKAQSSTHAELTAERARLAEQNWRLGMPNIPFTKVETDNFLIMGNVGEETLKDLGKKIEAVQPTDCVDLQHSRWPADDQRSDVDLRLQPALRLRRVRPDG